MKVSLVADENVLKYLAELLGYKGEINRDPGECVKLGYLHELRDDIYANLDGDKWRQFAEQFAYITNILKTDSNRKFTDKDRNSIVCHIEDWLNDMARSKRKFMEFVEKRLNGQVAYLFQVTSE